MLAAKHSSFHQSVCLPFFTSEVRAFFGDGGISTSKDHVPQVIKVKVQVQVTGVFFWGHNQSSKECRKEMKKIKSVEVLKQFNWFDCVYSGKDVELLFLFFYSV